MTDTDFEAQVDTLQAQKAEAYSRGDSVALKTAHQKQAVLYESRYPSGVPAVTDESRPAGLPVHQQYPDRAPAPSAAAGRGIVGKIPVLTTQAVAQAWQNMAHWGASAVSWLRWRWQGAEAQHMEAAWRAAHMLLTPTEREDVPADPRLFLLASQVGARLARGEKTPRFIAIDAAGQVAPWLHDDDVAELQSLIEEADPAAAYRLWREWGSDAEVNIRYGCCAARHMLTKAEIEELPVEIWVWQRLAGYGRRLVYGGTDENSQLKGELSMADRKELQSRIDDLQEQKNEAKGRGQDDKFKRLHLAQKQLYEELYPADANDQRIVGSSGRTF